MKRVELKRIAEILWKGNSSDEKMPFASQGTVPDNGSFSKNSLESDDMKKLSPKESPDDECENSEGPMSIPRKICFVMSFNAWVLYFLALGWLIPCRHMECGAPYLDVVETNLSDVWLLTNVEAVNENGLPSLAIFGYINGTESKLAAVETFDASYVWNNSLPFTPRNIQCNFENPFDVDADGITDCLLLGSNHVYAFNATNGHVLWNQSNPCEEGNIRSKFHSTVVRNSKGFLIGTCGDKMVVLRASNGTKISEIDLPCETPFEIMIVSHAVSGNFTLWSLVCDYGDKVEAWAFGEQDVLNGGKLENKAAASEFTLLFSGSNSGGSIDLGCDVTYVPGGPLLLSWSDRVVMVTPEAIAWERHFPEPLSVSNIKVGHFSNSKEWQVAAAVHNATNTIIHILEIKNGSTVDSTTLNGKQAQSMEMIRNEFDLLVLKLLSFNYTTQPVNNFTDPIPTEQTNFVLIDFSNGTFNIKDIVTTSPIVEYTLNVQTTGETDLLIIKTDNGFTSYLKLILHDVDIQGGSNFCIKANKRHHYSFET